VRAKVTFLEEPGEEGVTLLRMEGRGASEAGHGGEVLQEGCQKEDEQV
jgi:hypothetical protein